MLGWRCLLSTSEIKIEKILSANDVGKTNSHQAGFLIPSHLVKMNLFPTLEDEELNPRLLVNLLDLKNSYEYVVNYIKYNNRKFGGTRYEYRLTGVLDLIRHNSLRAGDSIFFRPINFDSFSVSFLHRSHKSWDTSSQGWTVREGESDG